MAQRRRIIGNQEATSVAEHEFLVESYREDNLS